MVAIRLPSIAPNVGAALENRRNHWLRLVTFQKPILIQIVHLDQSNPSGVTYTADNRRVVARLQSCNHCRLTCRCRSVPAVLNIGDLVRGDNTTDNRRLPIVVGTDQRSALVM